MASAREHRRGRRDLKAELVRDGRALDDHDGHVVIEALGWHETGHRPRAGILGRGGIPDHLEELPDAVRERSSAALH